MKKISSAAEKFLVMIILTVALVGCKDGEKGSDNWFSGGDEFSPITAAELKENWESIPKDSIKFSGEVKKFYESRSFAPLWNEEKIQQTFAEELARAEEEGLFLKDYLPTKLQKLLNSEVELSAADRAAKEVLLTNSFFQFANDLFYGKVDPKELYSLWGLKREKLDPAELLSKITAEEDISRTLDSLKPGHPVYAGLKESLQEYKAKIKEDNEAVKIEEGETIDPGDKDNRTPKIAQRLKQLGYIELDSLENDSVYNKDLAAAVEKFQADKGLEPDGVIGNSTLQVLNQDNSDRYKKVLVNLERWRWYPRDLGEHYILVNVADFKLAVVKDGDTVRTHNVIAGSKQRQTPVFTDTLEYIVINPLWNIPPTIQEEDIIPKASRNPSYLANNNMTVTAPNGDVLDPSEIDWSSSEVKDYRFSQSAGPSNPLGRVKIIYPNKYLIYLHDTPSKALFNRADRAESSGCVRVENAIDLAAYVVENQENWTLEQIQEQIASGVTKHVKIERPIQVHHFYWTAWRGLDKTYFADDVYDLDAELYSALTGSP